MTSRIARLVVLKRLELAAATELQAVEEASCGRIRDELAELERQWARLAERERLPAGACPVVELQRLAEARRDRDVELTRLDRLIASRLRDRDEATERLARARDKVGQVLAALRRAEELNDAACD